MLYARFKGIYTFSSFCPTNIPVERVSDIGVSLLNLNRHNVTQCEAKHLIKGTPEHIYLILLTKYDFHEFSVMGLYSQRICTL